MEYYSKNIFLVILILILNIQAFNKLGFEIKTGLNASNVLKKNENWFSPKNKYFKHTFVSLSKNFEFLNKFILEIEIAYCIRGKYIEVTISPDSVVLIENNSKQYLHRAEFLINTGLLQQLYSKHQLNFNIGIGYSRNVFNDGILDVTVRLPGETENRENEEIIKYSNFQKNDIIGNVEIKYKYLTRYGNYIVGIKLIQGFIDRFKGSVNKLNAFEFRIGYGF